MLGEMIYTSGGGGGSFIIDDIPRNKMQTDTGGEVSTNTNLSASGYIIIDNSDLSFIPVCIGTTNIYQFNTGFTIKMEGSDDDGATWTELCPASFHTFGSAIQGIQCISLYDNVAKALYKKYKLSFTRTSGAANVCYFYNNFFKGLFV